MSSATQSKNQSTTPIVAAADAVLGHCVLAIEAADDSAYTAPSARVAGGTIGSHIRHTLDHYRSALGAQSGKIDYDHRDRQVPLETDRAKALAEITSLRTRMTVLAQTDLDAQVTAQIMLDGSGTEAFVGSTLGRELWFCAHHAIHHLAIIKAIAGEHGVELPAGVGMAPSTLNFLAEQN